MSTADWDFSMVLSIKLVQIEVTMLSQDVEK